MLRDFDNFSFCAGLFEFRYCGSLSREGCKKDMRGRGVERHKTSLAVYRVGDKNSAFKVLSHCVPTKLSRLCYHFCEHNSRPIRFTYFPLTLASTVIFATLRAVESLSSNSIRAGDSAPLFGVS